MSRSFGLRRAPLVLLLAAAAIFGAGTTVVLASDRFTDVSTTSGAHDPIGHIVDAGIAGSNTCSGAAAPSYCPQTLINRGSLAVFLSRGLSRTAQNQTKLTSGVTSCPDANSCTGAIAGEVNITTSGVSSSVNGNSATQWVYVSLWVKVSGGSTAVCGSGGCEVFARIREKGVTAIPGATESYRAAMKHVPYNVRSCSSGTSCTVTKAGGNTLSLAFRFAARPGVHTYQAVVGANQPTSGSGTFIAVDVVQLEAVTLAFGNDGSDEGN